MSAAQRLAPASFARARGLTIWFSVPSVLGLLLQANQLTEGSFGGTLRLALFCGEALSPGYAQAWIRTQAAPIVNLYGPTEATIACTFHRVGVDAPFDASRVVPIGRPCAGTEIVVLRDDSSQASRARSDAS